MRAKAIDQRLRALDRLENDGRPRSALEVACINRQRMDLEHGHERGLVWDEVEAVRAIEFCGLLRHWKGEWAGKQFLPEPFQEQLILAPLFGWYRNSTRTNGGLRRFRVGYCEMPRKQGKTSLAAPISLQGLIADGEHGAEVYAAATKRDQANILFDDARNMLRGSTHLMKLCKLWKHSITCATLNSSFKPLSADAHSMHGLNVSRAIVDEIHSHKTRDVWDVLQTATGSRRMPLIFGITTAGFDRSSICWELHERVRQILDGSLDTQSFDDTFGFIACAEETDDPFDPMTHWKANPNYDISIKASYLIAEAAKAKASPAYENTFRRLHLNQWTEQEVRWMPMEAWNQCGEPFNVDELVGRECYGGLDIASTRDLASFVLVFPMDDGTYRVLPWFWCPRETVTMRDKQDRQSYMGWVPKFITATEGNTIDQSVIRRHMWDCAGKYDIRVVGFDGWNMDECYQQLVREGWSRPEETLLKVSQNPGTYNEAMQKILALARQKKLRHGGHPVLRWNASNVVVKPDHNGNIKPDKGRSGDKIDGFCALGMAFHMEIAKNKAPSVYEDRGLLVL